VVRSQGLRQRDTTTLQRFQVDALRLVRVLQRLGEDQKTTVRPRIVAVQLDAVRVIRRHATDVADVAATDPLRQVEVDLVDFRHVHDAVPESRQHRAHGEVSDLDLLRVLAEDPVLAVRAGKPDAVAG
jgi:hypothetical protein